MENTFSGEFLLLFTVAAMQFSMYPVWTENQMFSHLGNQPLIVVTS